MKLPHSILFFLYVTVCAGQTTGMPDEVVKIIQQRVDQGIYPGVAVGIIDENGAHYYNFGVTTTGGRAIDEHTIFEIGSISKTFTAILLADMTVQGMLSVDDPVSRFLPAQVTIPTRADMQITFGQLSDHTSSLPRLPDNMQPADPMNPYADYTIDQMYAFLSSYTLTRDIGSQYEYSNFAAGLLGHVLALKAGMSYEDLMVKTIAEPLHMDDTRITFTEHMKKNLALPHSQGLIVSNWDFLALEGAGAIRSTTADMLNYLAANMSLSDTPLASAMQMSHQVRHDKAGSDRVGLGWHIRASAQGDIVWHNGGTGGYRSFAGLIQTSGRGVVVLTNSDIGADDIGFYLLDSSTILQSIKPHVAIELKKCIDEEGVDKVREKFSQIKLEHADKYDFGEVEINSLGYYYLGQKNVDAALALFEINTQGHPESANVWDSYGEALLEKGDNEAAIENYKKSLELNPGNMNAVDILAQLGINLSVPDVRISEDILQEYVGSYELAPNFNIVITRDGTQLHGQATGQPRFELFPKTDTEFYLKVVDAQITFNINDDGSIKSLTLFQGGQVLEGKKVE